MSISLVVAVIVVLVIVFLFLFCCLRYSQDFGLFPFIAVTLVDIQVILRVSRCIHICLFHVLCYGRWHWIVIVLHLQRRSDLVNLGCRLYCVRDCLRAPFVCTTLSRSRAVCMLRQRCSRGLEWLISPQIPRLISIPRVDRSAASRHLSRQSGICKDSTCEYHGSGK